MADHRIDVASAVTHTYRPSHMLEAYEILHTKDPTHVKSVVDFQ